MNKFMGVITSWLQLQYNLDWVRYIVPGWWVMKISNQFQMLHLAHPNSTGADISVALVGDHLNGKSWILYFIYSLQKKINISRPNQNFQKTKQKNTHCLLLYFLMFQFIPIPNNHRFGCREKQNIVFEWCWWFQQPTVPPGHGGWSLPARVRPFCPTSSCRTVSTNSWVKPVVMPAMRCCGRFRSSGEHGGPGYEQPVFTEVTRCFLVFVGPCLFAKFVNINTCGSWINTV